MAELRKCAAVQAGIAGMVKRVKMFSSAAWLGQHWMFSQLNHEWVQTLCAHLTVSVASPLQPVVRKRKTNFQTEEENRPLKQRPDFDDDPSKAGERDTRPVKRAPRGPETAAP
eukprot:9484201-Pyramimonas_sp.AAC.1